MERRPFGGSRTKWHLLGLYGLPLWLCLSPQRRISLPVRQVGVPKKRLIHPNVLLQRYFHRVRQVVHLCQVDHLAVFRLPRHSHLRIRLN